MRRLDSQYTVGRNCQTVICLATIPLAWSGLTRTKHRTIPVKNLERVALVLALPTLAGVGYVVYLAAGGMAGRESIKATLARARMDATYTIRTPEGGDCGRIGTWEPQTRTCTLDRDLENGATLWIRDDAITMDGNGHRMTGGETGRAVTIIGASRVALVRLVIEGYEEAVYAHKVTRSSLSELTIRGTSGHAIHLTGEANYNAIINNDVGPSKMHGIATWFSHGNLIANNRIRQTVDAIRLQSSDGNVIVLNEVAESEIEGVDLHLSSANRVFLNSILETKALPILDDGPGANLYYLGLGGNFFAKYDSAAGCNDQNGDGLCDAEFKFAIGADQRPLIQPARSITGTGRGDPLRPE